jgi:hypothetical protein
VQYQSDYVLRIIEQMGGLIRRALERMRAGGDEESYDLAQQALGLALDIDPSVASRLSPESLRSILELHMPDERVLELMAKALEIEGQALGGDGEFLAAQLRFDQAEMVRRLMDPGRAN